jgi:hypothetical protein
MNTAFYNSINSIKNKAMKKPIILRSIGMLAIILVFFAHSARAQVTATSPGSLQVGNAETANQSNTQKLKAIICKNGTFELDAAPATTDDDSKLPSGVTRIWKWEEVTQTSTALIATATQNKLTQAEFPTTTPGYHTFRLTTQYKNANGTAFCPSQTEDFTIFILPDLNVTAKIDDPSGNASTVFCTTSLPNSSDPNAVKLTATASFKDALNTGNPLTAPGIGDFEIAYSWYRLPKADAATFDPNNPGSVQPVATTPTGATSTSSYSLDLTGVANGVYEYVVAVKYTVKSCGIAYSVSTQSNGSTPLEISVVPAPGKPSITIQ